MKKILLLTMIFSFLILSGCSLDSSNETDYYDPVDAMEVVLDYYSFSEVAEYYDEYILLEYAYETMGIPNMPIIIEELEYAKMYDEIEHLFLLADKAGYYPSTIYGPFCTDNRLYLIHLTDSECVNDIPFQDRGCVSPMVFSEIGNEIEDDDSYLEGYSLCTKCFPE